MNYNQIKEVADSVDGWLSEKEGRILYELAQNVTGRGVIVEVGSWQGKSTLYLAAGLISKGSDSKIYAVDPHIGSEEHHKEFGEVWTYDKFLKNIERAGVSNKISPIVDTSIHFSENIKEPVEFIFIDGAHDFKSVADDFAAWLPKVVEGGVMAFHDSYTGGDPYKVLRKELYLSRSFGVIRMADSITYATKLQRNSIFVWFRNIATLVRKDIFLGISKIKWLNRILLKMKKLGA